MHPGAGRSSFRAPGDRFCSKTECWIISRSQPLLCPSPLLPFLRLSLSVSFQVHHSLPPSLPHLHSASPHPYRHPQQDTVQAELRLMSVQRWHPDEGMKASLLLLPRSAAKSEGQVSVERPPRRRMASSAGHKWLRGFCPKWNTQWIVILESPPPHPRRGGWHMGGGAEEVDWKDWRCPGGLPRVGEAPV